MKRLIALFALVFVMLSTSQAQGIWSDFWHPRPSVVMQNKMSLEATAAATIFQLKPAAAFTFLSFRPSNISGQPWESGLLAGGGPELTLVNTYQDDNGLNIVNWSTSLAFLVTGDTKDDPNFEPALALFFAAPVIIPAAQIGIEFDLSPRPGGESRVALLLSLTILPTLN
jgi:hypothetical protein